MTSSFLICYPDVPPSSLVVSTSSAYDVDYPIECSFYGRRHNYAQLAATASTVVITYDLGAGNSRTVNHFIVGGGQVLLSSSVNGVVLAGSNNGSAWTNQLGTSANYATRTFNGPDGDDLIFTPGYNDEIAGVLAAYRYFRVTITKSLADLLFPVSKLYFGSAFDMGCEPSTYDMTVDTEEDADTWVFHRGQPLVTKAFHPKHRFTVEWDGVSDAMADAFETTILENPYRNYVYLYAGNYADPLYDNKLVLCEVVADECSIEKQYDDWNVVKAVFKESI